MKVMVYILSTFLSYLTSNYVDIMIPTSKKEHFKFLL